MEADGREIENCGGGIRVEVKRRNNEDQNAQGAPAFHSYPQPDSIIPNPPEVQMRPGVVTRPQSLLGVLPVSAKAKPDLGSDFVAPFIRRAELVDNNAKTLGAG